MAGRRRRVSIADLENRRTWLLVLLKRLQRRSSYELSAWGAPLGVAVGGTCIPATKEAAELVATAALGPRPEGALLVRRCSTHGCCAPSHVFWGTHSDAMRDKLLRGGVSGRRARAGSGRLESVRARLVRVERALRDRLTARVGRLAGLVAEEAALRAMPCVHVSNKRVQRTFAKLGGQYRRCGDQECVAAAHMKEEPVREDLVALLEEARESLQRVSPASMPAYPTPLPGSLDAV